MLFSAFSASTTRIQLQPLNQEVLLLACSLLFTSFVWFRLISFCGRLLTNSYYTSRFFCKTSKKKIKVQAKMLLKVMTACRPNIGHGKQTGITFPHQEWNPASGTFRKMPAVQPDSFCLKSDWTHTTAFPNQRPPMTHDRGVGLDRLLYYWFISWLI